jgi:hypothetical protein
MKGTDTNVGGGVDADSFIFSHNFWFAHDDARRSRPSWLKPEEGSIVGVDPKFTKPESGEYLLSADSPARGKGVPAPKVRHDFNGQLFTQPPAMGAFR